jgi:excisionase family DNA binding protein
VQRFEGPGSHPRPFGLGLLAPKRKKLELRAILWSKFPLEKRPGLFGLVFWLCSFNLLVPSMLFSGILEGPMRRYTGNYTRNLSLALQHLKQALDVHHRSLEELESALVEFEESLLSGAEVQEERPQVQQQGGSQRSLLSIAEVCQELGMGKSWVYKRIQSGDIPSVKLGHNIKVKREDLEIYLERQRNQPPSAQAS